MNYVILVVIWAMLAIIVAVLAAYRIVIAWRENDIIHLRDGEMGQVAQQSAIAHKIEWADRWGKLLTAVTVVYGLILATAYLYQVVMDSGTRIQ